MQKCFVIVFLQKLILTLCDNLYDKGDWLSLVPFNNSALLKAGDGLVMQFKRLRYQLFDFKSAW